MTNVAHAERSPFEALMQGLAQDVELVLFTQSVESEPCHLGRMLTRGLAECSAKIKLTIRDFVRDADAARRLGIERIPAVALLANDGADHGIRFYGPPHGYQLGVLAQDIARASHGDAGLPRGVHDKLRRLTHDLHLQVLVTPTCPYCASAVLTAHRFAMASDRIRADMIDITAFPFMAVRYEAREVPCTIVNETHQLCGLMSESQLAEALVRLQEEGA